MSLQLLHSCTSRAGPLPIEDILWRHCLFRGDGSW